MDPDIKSDYIDLKLSRIQLKNVNIMKDLVLKSNKTSPEKYLTFKFSSPIDDINYEDDKIILKIHNSDNFEYINFDLLVECTGFYQKQTFSGLQQDCFGKFITSEKYKIKDNIYTCGWSKTGPKGNIADSMLEASNCAKQIYNDRFLNK